MATFLPKGKRIHLKLKKATLNRGGSTRQHNFQLVLDLTEGDDTLVGLPEWIQNAYTNLIKTANYTDLVKFELAFGDETLEFYGSAKAKTRLWPVVLKAKLAKFSMIREGEEEDAVVKLFFTALFDTTKVINEWVFDDEDGEFYMSSESAQQDLNLTGVQTKAPAAEEDDDKEEDELEAQARRKEENSAARTTPLIPLVPRRIPGPRAVNPHN